MKRIFGIVVSFLIGALAQAGPLVYITGVKVDGNSINIDGTQTATVQPNQTFWIDVTIQNQGDSWSGHGQLCSRESVSGSGGKAEITFGKEK